MKPISQNGYLYANGDPINHIDPDGHFSLKKAWNTAKSKAKSVVKKAVKTVKTVAKKVTKTVKKAVKTVKKAVVKTTKKVVQKTKQVVKKTTQAVKKVVKKTTQAVKSVAKKTTQVVKKAVNTVKQTAQKAVKVVKAVSKVVQSTIKEGWEYTKIAARRATEEAKKVVKETIDKTVEVAKEGVAKVGEFMESKTGKMVLAGLQVVGGALQVAAGVALMSTGVGSVLGALVLAHGVNSMISGAADGYYAATNQDKKMGTVNLLRDYVYKPVLGKDLGEKAFNAADFALGFAGGGVKNAANAATHVDDVAKAFGKVLDDVPTAALKPSTATNAGRNLVESGSKSAGRVGGSSFDELATVSLVSKSRNAADHGATFAGKSSSVSRNADEGFDYSKQAASKSLSKPVESKVTDLSDYRAKRAETKAADEDLNFGKSANHDVQSMDMSEKLGSKSSNVISMDVQAKAPIKGMEDSFQMKKVSGGEGIDYDAIGLPKQKQLDLVVNNEFSSNKNSSEFMASTGGRMDSHVDGIPSASGASRVSSSAGKIPTEGNSKGATFEGIIYRSVQEGHDPLLIHEGNIATNHRYTAEGTGGLYFSTGEKIVNSELNIWNVPSAGRVMHSFEVKIDNLLDVSNVNVRKQLGIKLEDLIGESYDVTHRIGQYAKKNGYNGIVAPSARADGGLNLIIFDSKTIKP